MMPLLGFTKLKKKLLDGTKTQTIRKPRKTPFKVGDKLFVYWKLRTKQCEKLGEAVVTKIVRKCLGEMTMEDAVNDGFDGVIALHSALISMHKIRYYPFKEEFDIITFEWTKRGRVERNMRKFGFCLNSKRWLLFMDLLGVYPSTCPDKGDCDRCGYFTEKEETRYLIRRRKLWGFSG